MSSLIPCSTSDISLIPRISFNIKNNDYFSRRGLTRKSVKYRFSSQRVVLPLPVSVFSFPQLRRECTLLRKPLLSVVRATGSDVAVEETVSPVVDDDSEGATEIQNEEDTSDKSSTIADVSSAPAQTRRLRPARKTEMPPVKNEELFPGATFMGKVRAIQPFGAFVDFGAFTDGLVHVSRLSDNFVKDVGSVVTVGQEVKVTLVEVNFENKRISLTMRETEETSKPQQRKDSSATATSDRPRPSLKGTQLPRREDAKSSKFVKGQELNGTVKNVTRNGAFINLPEGEEGFLPTAEEADGGLASMMGDGGSSLDIGQEVTVRVLRVSRAQITLTMKTEEDSNSNVETVHGVIHSATNPFVLAFRQNEDIAKFLDGREKVDKATKQSVEPVTSAEIETTVDIPEVEDQPTSSGEDVTSDPSAVDETSTEEAVGASLITDNIEETSTEESLNIDAIAKDEAHTPSPVEESEVTSCLQVADGVNVTTDENGSVAGSDTQKDFRSIQEAKDEVKSVESSAPSDETSNSQIQSSVSPANKEDEKNEQQIPTPDSKTRTESVKDELQIPSPTAETEIDARRDEEQIPKHTCGTETGSVKDEPQISLPTAEVEIEANKEKQIITPSPETGTETAKDEQQTPSPPAKTEIGADKEEEQIPTPSSKTESESVRDELQTPLTTAETEIEADKEEEQILTPASETEVNSVKTEIEADKEEEHVSTPTSQTEVDSFQVEIEADKDEEQVPAPPSETAAVKDELQIPTAIAKTEIAGDTDTKQIPTPINESESKIDEADSEQSVNVGNLNGQNRNPSPKENVTKATISPALVKQLREETGAGMMDCKKALSETGGDIVKAQEFLRKKGLASADKKASRVTAEGRIGSYIHDSRIGVLIEVNCETDFVARGEIFKELVDDLAMQVAACPQVQYLATEDVPEEIVNKEKEIEMQKEDLVSKPEQIRSKIVEGRIRKRLEDLALLEQPYIKNDKVVVKDLVKQTIATIGENMKVRRFVRFNLGEGLEKKSQDFAAEVAAQTAAKKSMEAPAKEQPVAPEAKEDSPKPAAVAVSAALVKQLREETGAGMMDCKKALAETGGDIEKAQEYLRKKGLSSADKKLSRLAAEGRVGSYIHDSRIGVLIEVNCETDFVGRSEKFMELVDDLAMQVVACPQAQFVSMEEVPESIIKKEKEIEMQREDILSKPENIRERIVEGRVSKRLGELALLEQPFIKDDSLLIRDLVKRTVATLGENIKVRRFVRFTLGESEDTKTEAK